MFVYDSGEFPASAPVQKEILFVARNWSSPSRDLWEETYASGQFYDCMVQRKALVLRTAFPERTGDKSTVQILKDAEAELTKTLKKFRDPLRGILVYEDGPVHNNQYAYLDTAIILGVIHGYAGDGVFSYSSEFVQATAVRLSTTATRASLRAVQMSVGVMLVS